MGMRVRSTVATAALTGALAVGSALAGSAPALADPPPADPDAPPTDVARPPSTGLIPPPSTIGTVLGQTGTDAAGPIGLPDLSKYGANMLLGQNAAPAPPGAATLAGAPDLRALDNQYLLPQNVTPAAPGQGVPEVGLGSGDPNAATGRLAFLRRLHAMYQAGDLEGALLGQRPAEQLGEPLPGTAPGPDIYLPMGLGQNLSEPAPPPSAPPG